MGVWGVTPTRRVKTAETHGDDKGGANICSWQKVASSKHKQRPCATDYTDNGTTIDTRGSVFMLHCSTELPAIRVQNSVPA